MRESLYADCCLSLDLNAMINDDGATVVLGMVNDQWRMYLLDTNDADLTPGQLTELLDSLNQHRPPTRGKTWFYSVGEALVFECKNTRSLKFLEYTDTEPYELLRLFTSYVPNTVEINTEFGESYWIDVTGFSIKFGIPNPTSEEVDKQFSKFICQAMALILNREHHYDEQAFEVYPVGYIPDQSGYESEHLQERV